MTIIDLQRGGDEVEWVPMPDGALARIQTNVQFTATTENGRHVFAVHGQRDVARLKRDALAVLDAEATCTRYHFTPARIAA